MPIRDLPGTRGASNLDDSDASAARQAAASANDPEIAPSACDGGPSADAVEQCTCAPSPPHADTVTAGAALLARLRRHGVDYLFANSGTDFPPLIEGLAEATALGLDVPQAVTVPHETAALAMAHGYYFGARRAQAVMVHTNVGLANAAIGAINARADNIPMLLFSGRTPTTEKGRFGSRTVPIGWGQEMHDQTALVREACKWDYELRFPEQVNDVVDRAHGIACSTPAGPVYVSLPREVLCEPVDREDGDRRVQMAPGRSAPQAADIARAAELLANAERPAIFAQRGAGSAEAFAALSALADEWSIPVCQYWAVQLAVPTTHPMAAPLSPVPLLDTADVILAIDALAPWAPDVKEPKESCQVIQLGVDPLFSQTPIRNFRSDLSLPGEVAPSILALKRAMDDHLPAHRARCARRRAGILSQNAVGIGARRARVSIDTQADTLTKAWVSQRLSDRLQADTQPGSVFAELGCQMRFMDLPDQDSWFESPHSGGLGWGLPAAMGFKLARPERRVISTIGDGSYIFANPVACHQIAQALGISIVVIVLNNAAWGAVRNSVLDLYPDGYAAKHTPDIPLTELAPSPRFTAIAEAGGALSFLADTRERFDQALEAALAHTDAGRGLALIEVQVAKDEHLGLQGEKIPRYGHHPHRTGHN